MREVNSLGTMEIRSTGSVDVIAKIVTYKNSSSEIIFNIIHFPCNKGVALDTATQHTALYV